jgi:hypothetical protein
MQLKPDGEEKRLLIIAPSGSGKTYFAKKGLIDDGDRYIPGRIWKSLDSNPDDHHARRQLTVHLAMALNKPGLPIAINSGNIIPQAVWLPEVDLHVSRVCKRWKEQGEHRYPRTIKQIYDNRDWVEALAVRFGIPIYQRLTDMPFIECEKTFDDRGLLEFAEEFVFNTQGVLDSTLQECKLRQDIIRCERTLKKLHEANILGEKDWRVDTSEIDAKGLAYANKLDTNISPISYVLKACVTYHKRWEDALNVITKMKKDNKFKVPDKIDDEYVQISKRVVLNTIADEDDSDQKIEVDEFAQKIESISSDDDSVFVRKNKLTYVPEVKISGRLGRQKKKTKKKNTIVNFGNALITKKKGQRSLRYSRPSSKKYRLRKPLNTDHI